MNGRKTDRQMYIYKELLSIYTITSDGFFASFNTWFQYCISYWLYSESTTLWHEKAYKIFCEYFFVWFMKPFFYLFTNLGAHPKTGSNFNLDFPMVSKLRRKKKTISLVISAFRSLHCTKNEVFHQGVLHFLCSAYSLRLWLKHLI